MTSACSALFLRFGATFIVLSGFGFAPIQSSLSQENSLGEFWVAPNGSDLNPGTRAEPLASVAMALRKTRELRRLANPPLATPVHIFLRGGVHHMTEPLFIRSEDSGSTGSPTIIESASGEQPVLSGGLPITGWRKASGKIPGLPRIAYRQVWSANVPTFAGRTLLFRQLWVDDRKAVRARQPNGELQARLLTWNRTNQEAWLPPSVLDGLREPSHAEMILNQQWEIAICRLKSIYTDGNRSRIQFQQPESRIEFEHPWPQPVMSSNGAPFFLVNAIEFLDQPGEWFEDVSARRVYYWPRWGEDMTSARVVGPALETLVRMEGSPDKPVDHIQFNGIEFAHTTWLRPSKAGHVPLQAGMYLLDAYKLSPKGTPNLPHLDNQAWIGRPPAAVSAQNANHIHFENCRFTHLASAGLDFESGAHDDVVEGCVFRDIGGNGIQLGKFSDPGVETHMPYNPSDKREICSRERIANNLVTDCANEDWGCVGICAGYVRDCVIEHNDLSNLSYTGISVGWGWTKATNCMSGNRVIANHVHHVATRMGDTAGIYMLSAQPGSIVAENSVHDIRMSPYVFDPNHWFYLYLDEGSSFITVRDNWCPAEKFLKNANGPGNVWTNNGPMVSPAIRDAAGLEPAFRGLFTGEHLKTEAPQSKFK